ncbi:uncharacterized protein LTR77_009676 [Saxophila tyrrhenica]|uniref:Peptidase S53 activation domain-containing protein n=1 Tax=Saxophila tyrrhenica TaxID=1690608 RepID=A0AAV9NXH5_9PEZI|nr:hypothetical protein LTR77_009676 [Saxophila tyrrhenica]
MNIFNQRKITMRLVTAFVNCSILCSLLTSATVLPHTHVLHEKREVPFAESIDRQRIEPDAILPIRIGLNTNGDATRLAEQWIMAVSDPASADYGRHWTQDQVTEAFQPTEQTVNTVKAWLEEHGINRYTHSTNKQWIAFDTTAAKAEELLQTNFFEHQHSSGRTLASCDSYHLPDSVSAVVDYITPGVKASDVTGRTRRSRQRRHETVGEQAVQRRDPTSDNEFPFPPDPTDLSRCD